MENQIYFVLSNCLNYVIVIISISIPLFLMGWEFCQEWASASVYLKHEQLCRVDIHSRHWSSHGRTECANFACSLAGELWDYIDCTHTWRGCPSGPLSCCPGCSCCTPDTRAASCYPSLLTTSQPQLRISLGTRAGNESFINPQTSGGFVSSSTRK